MGGRPDLQDEIKDAVSQKPDDAVAGSTKRLASRFYQIKTGHCLSGQYLHWAKNRPTPQCWWCRYENQTREHLFKVFGVEGQAEDPVDGSAEGNWEMEEPVADPGHPGGCEVQSRGAGFPYYYG
jgi:hypothetical protein